MRPNIVTEAGLQTRVRQWWDGVPFTTSAVVIVCGAIYSICLLVGYDSFEEICFLPSAIVSHFQVYRIYTSILFHVSLIHVVFNMMALVPLGSELERIMGSVRLVYVVLLLSSFVGRAKFIMCSGGNTSGYIPTHTAETTSPSALFSGNTWRNLSSWLPQRETPIQSQPAEDHRFPGRARTLAPPSLTGSGNSDTNLQARLLDPEPSPDRSRSAGDNAVAAIPQTTSQQQNLATSDVHIQNLLSMGFEKTQVEVALAAADGDVNVAVEILMSQQG